jgi:hypothetical protein
MFGFQKLQDFRGSGIQKLHCTVKMKSNGKWQQFLICFFF